MEGKVCQCPFCGRLYEFHSMMVGDQSCCPICRESARNLESPDSGIRGFVPTYWPKTSTKFTWMC